MKIFEIFFAFFKLISYIRNRGVEKIFESFSRFFNFYQTTCYLLIKTRFKAQTSQSAEDI